MASNPAWSELPQELLLTIAIVLSWNRLDIISFRSVCKSWHSSSRNIRHRVFNRFFPLDTPPPPIWFSRGLGPPLVERYVISITIVYSLRNPENPPSLFKPNTWICFLDQWNRGAMSVRKPLPERMPQRSYSSPIYFPRRLNMTEFHASEVSRFYNFVRVDNENNKGLVWPREILKVIVLSNMSTIVILSRDGILYTKDLEDYHWQTIHVGRKGFRFDDIVEFKNTVLGVDRKGRLYEIGLDNYPVKFDRIIRSSTGGEERRKRLVESLGELYLVVRCDNVHREGVELKVYQLLFDTHNLRQWGPVTEIGDRVFFFDLQFSFSASTQQLGGVYRNNSIIYNQQSFWKNVVDEDSDNYNKFGLCHLEDPSYISTIEEKSSNFKVFWPPPYWIF